MDSPKPPPTRQDRVRRLENELEEALATHQGSKEMREKDTQKTEEAREALNSIQREKDSPLRPMKSPLSVRDPLVEDEGGLLQLTSLYEAIGDTRELQRVSLKRPKEFTENEILSNPYALMQWYRQVSCWARSYASTYSQRLVFAIQALRGLARILINNTNMEDRTRIKNIDELIASLKEML